MKKTNVLVLSGGFNAEREVNLLTAQNVLANLDVALFSVSTFDLTQKSLPKLLQFKKYFPRVHVVLIAIAGTFVEDGYAQAILESQGVAHTGSSVYASAAAFDKNIASAVAAGSGLRVPQTLVYRTRTELPHVSPLSFPVVIKPIANGSSVGVRVVRSKKEYGQSINSLTSSDFPLLVSQYIAGIELTCPVLGGQALPVVEIVPPKGRSFDYQAKYFDTETQEICPARISQSLTRQVQKQAERMHAVLGCKGLTRTDFIYDARARRLYFIEINTLPGLSAASLAPKSARVAGMSLSQLLPKLIHEALSVV